MSTARTQSAASALVRRTQQVAKTLAVKAPLTGTTVLARVESVQGRTVTLTMTGVPVPGVALNKSYAPSPGDLVVVDVLASGDVVVAYAVG